MVLQIGEDHRRGETLCIDSHPIRPTRGQPGGNVGGGAIGAPGRADAAAAHAYGPEGYGAPCLRTRRAEMVVSALRRRRSNGAKSYRSRATGHDRPTLTHGLEAYHGLPEDLAQIETPVDALVYGFHQGGERGILLSRPTHSRARIARSTRRRTPAIAFGSSADSSASSKASSSLRSEVLAALAFVDSMRDRPVVVARYHVAGLPNTFTHRRSAITASSLPQIRAEISEGAAITGHE